MISNTATVVGRGKSERKAQTANQLVPRSPVAKKDIVDWPIRTESTESVRVQRVPTEQERWDFYQS